MSNKSTIEVDDKVGVCIKTEEKLVTFQNASCQRYCGNMMGQICEKGCMKSLAEMPEGSLRDNDFISFKNIFPAEAVLDALVLKNNGTLTTLLFDVSRTVDEQMLLVAPFELTPSETSVVRMVLEGASNAEIAKKLCIARSTLKSHLNHIYRKLPDTLGNQILGRRGGIPKNAAPKDATVAATATENAKIDRPTGS